MKRFRLSTLLLLVVIAALGLALVVQERRAARREDDIQWKYVVMEHVLTHPVVPQVEGIQILQLEAESLQALPNQLTAEKGEDR
jgi:hypothetical protein